MGFEVRYLRRHPLTRVRIAAGPFTIFTYLFCSAKAVYFFQTTPLEYLFRVEMYWILSIWGFFRRITGRMITKKISRTESGKSQELIINFQNYIKHKILF